MIKNFCECTQSLKSVKDNGCSNMYIYFANLNLTYHYLYTLRFPYVRNVVFSSLNRWLWFQAACSKWPDPQTGRLYSSKSATTSAHMHLADRSRRGAACLPARPSTLQPVWKCCRWSPPLDQGSTCIANHHRRYPLPGPAPWLPYPGGSVEAVGSLFPRRSARVAGACLPSSKKCRATVKCRPSRRGASFYQPWNQNWGWQIILGTPIPEKWFSRYATLRK